MRDGKIIAEHLSKETSEQVLYNELVASCDPVL